MRKFVAVAVNIPTQKDLFHYHLPEELADLVKAGHLVEVPFGNQTTQGVVFEFIDQPSVPETRPVLRLVDADLLLTEAQIELARWISHTSLAPLGSCLQLMLPPGSIRQTDILYTLREGWQTAVLGKTQARLVRLLRQRGPLRGRQIDAALPRGDWRSAARSLAHMGILQTQPVLPAATVRPKTVRTALLACPPDEAQKSMESLARKNSPALARRQTILRYLIEEKGAVEAPWLYAASGGNASDLVALAEQGLIHLSEAQIWRDPLGDLQYTPSQPLELTPDQKNAWGAIKASLQRTARGQQTAATLLHGVTGSGKTEIYLYAVEETLSLGRQALMLVPEIAMTPQTVRRFVARFPGQVGLFHSGLSSGERYDTWLRARQGKLPVIIGARSALFMPFSQLGLIILDECHDDSYYQSENMPHYHGRDTAQQYAQMINALCLMGTATPDVESRYLADQNKLVYLRLPERILAHRQAIQNQLARLENQRSAAAGARPVRSRYRSATGEAEASDLPPVTLVDMRQELKAGNRSIFSRALQDALQQTLQENEQAILFLNRRGSATHVLCRDCGYILKCPRCDIPLIYHREFQQRQQILVCHRCSYQRKSPSTCPECGSKYIRHLGAGTQRVEEEVHQLLPEARVLRWDYETTRQKGAHEIILAHFSNHQADVLVGTQMVAKSLDLPLVTLVGIVLADTGLNLPDLRAAERTFQVLSQVAGRAGRSPLGGHVILQTFQPQHYVIQAAVSHDYEQFYRQELEYRRMLGYPPFSQLVRLEYRDHDSIKAEKTAQVFAEKIRHWIEAEKRTATEIIGPAPCFFTRQDGAFRWQIILRGPDPTAILRGQNMSDWQVEVNPVSLL
jgi:primosomal protein N' (replication factor Y) (superfamily II helicase)